MRNRSGALATFVMAILLAICVANSYACMSFRVTAKDGNIMIGRTMEFGVDSHWKIAVIPRNMQFTSPAPGGKNGLTWKNKYGYLAVVGFGMDDMVADGMNEAGLSFGGLWYDPVKYQDIAPGEESRALAQTMSGAWILGNFATIDELKQAVAEIKIFGYVVPALGMAPPAHGIIYDASGKSVVMEFGNGKVELYDNPLGILTNAPDFPWHVNHLRQYIGMSNENPKPKEMAGQKFIPTGHGTGMIGLPGDLTPPSRFVRLGVTTYFADQPENADKALNLSQHIVNAFNIVSGMVVERSPQGKVVAKETTQWASFRDLTNKIFYFQTYENVDLRKVDLKKLDFTGDKPKFIDMYGYAQSVKDVTSTAK
ncbi:MAG: linear amide C-N hydrolase [Desulfomonilaceae bacterium]